MTRPSILAGLLLVAWARPADPAESYNLRREVAWARSLWGADLEGVHFEAPTAKLLDWVPRGGSLADP